MRDKLGLDSGENSPTTLRDDELPSGADVQADISRVLKSQTFKFCDDPKVN